MPAPGASPIDARSVIDTIRRWQSHAVSGTALMRELIGYEQWELPITLRSSRAMRASNASPEPWLYKDREGNSRLFLFTDRGAYRRYREAAGMPVGEQPFTATPGVSIFTRDLSALEAIHLDPLTADALTLGKELFARLNVVADAVRVERALDQLRGGSTRVSSQLSVVKRFQAYHVGMRDTPEGPRFALAPDPRSRYLAAVFTLNDGFEAYLQECAATGDATPLRRAVMTGEQLFRELLDTGLDGIVFNCCGPTPPVAFAPAFARLVIDSR